MFKFKDENLYVPIVGPLSYKNITFFAYEIIPNVRIEEREKFIQFKLKVKDFFNEKGLLTIQEEDLLISIMKEISENLRINNINNQKYQLQPKKIPDVKIPHYIEKFIHMVFIELIKPELQYKAFQNYILGKNKISESRVKELDLQLFRHNAIRYTVYIDRKENNFLCLLYPSYKLVIEPSLDKFIENDIDVMDLNVISNIPKIPSGAIVEIVKEPDVLIRQEINRLNREMKDKSIKISPDEPLIKIKTFQQTRDQYYPAKIFNIQARMDDEVFEQEFDWDLGDIQNQLQFDPQSFYNVIEPFRIKFTEKLSEILKT